MDFHETMGSSDEFWIAEETSVELEGEETGFVGCGEERRGRWGGVEAGVVVG